MTQSLWQSGRFIRGSRSRLFLKNSFDEYPLFLLSLFSFSLFFFLAFLAFTYFPRRRPPYFSFISPHSRQHAPHAYDRHMYFFSSFVFSSLSHTPPNQALIRLI
jgi:hypothetical protein